MAKLDIYNPQWLEVVFAGRNKAYGAYQLRSDNQKTTNRALIIGSILFILAVSSPLIAKYIGSGKEDDEATKVTEVVLTPPPPLDNKVVTPPPPNPEPPKPKVKQLKFPPLEVVPKEKVQEEPPTVEDLKEADPGQKNLEGDPNADVRIDEPVGTAPPREAAVTEDNGVYNVGTLEVMPEFPGGMNAFYKYVGKNYSYPAAAQEQGVSGKVILSFIVEKDGSLTDIKVLRDVGLGTGDAAVKMLKKAPHWKPGVQNGRNVRVAYTLPIQLQTELEQ